MEGKANAPFDKEVAVVTGGNRGIGLEICRQLASNGITVVLTARDETRGMEAVSAFGMHGLSNVVFHQLEVGDRSSTARLADFLRQKFGKLDILVSNAGIVGTVMEITDPESFQRAKDDMERIEWIRKHTTEPYEKAEECIKTNYHGQNMSQKNFFLYFSYHDMEKLSTHHLTLDCSGGEDLKNVNNLPTERLDDLSELFLRDLRNGQLEPHGWPVEGGYPAYKVSKALANAYSRIIAKEYPMLCVNCVHPGYVSSDINFHSGDLTVEEGARGALMLALIPKGGMTGTYLDCTEVASFMQFL